MVVALGPGKFYGSSLPRPRFYTDVKFKSDRVDHPVPVSDPLLSWANEAHWSMGGLSFNRLRLQGRIEGSIKKLRAHQKRSHRIKSNIRPEDDRIRMLDELEFEDSEPDPEPQPNKRVKKLADEFEMVADRVGYRTRSKKTEFDKSPVVKGGRTSPRRSLSKSSD